MPQPPRRNQTTYFGKHPETLSERYMWMWVDSRLRVKRGAEHGSELAIHGEDVEQHYRGWFDPASNELFLVRPDSPQGSMRGIPRILDRVLRRRFGEYLIYRAF